MTYPTCGKFRLLSAVTMLLSFFLPDIAEAQGLRFKGLETAIDERTSFTVFDNRTPTFENEFGIRFRFQSYRDAERGIIFRLADRALECVWGVSVASRSVTGFSCSTT